ncbi:hypothetical protein GCM10029978_112390 [Actinoallomurus acanthiterrae]
MVPVGAIFLLPGDPAVRGPYGAFPPPVAVEPPLHSAQPVARAQDPVIYRGIAVVAARDGVRAVNIVTGKVYWRYAPGGDPLAADPATGDVFVRKNRRLTMINVRSGRIGWSREIPSAIGDVTKFPTASLTPDAGAGARAIVGETGMAVLDRTSGKVRWMQRWPANCGRWGYPLAATSGIIAVICDDAGSLPAPVLGFDSVTGARRWTRAFTDLFPGTRVNGNGDSQDPFTGVWAVDGTLVVGTDVQVTASLDPKTGQVTNRRHWDRDPAAFSGGIQISSCGPDTLGNVCADDPKTGKPLWRKRMLVPQGPRGIAATRSRVYALDVVTDDTTQLTVLDLRTGAVLGKMPLPSAERGASFLGAVTDGIVVISPHDNATLLAERPDLHTAHDLQK